MSWGISASHVPVLTLIPRYYKVKRVLEIGSGELSTPLFLDKTIYPDLEDLRSVEDDPEWRNKVSTMYGTDNRLVMLPTVPVSLYGFDLIFLDGPQNEDRRAKTVRYIMKDLLPALIVIHDIENKKYKKEVNKEYKKYEFNFIKSPRTALFSREPIAGHILGRKNLIMKKNFSKIEENWLEWKKIL